MINFFRHIRRTFLIEGNMSKYLKYAIGEILLVMVGILLALQVNNWNENRKLSKKQDVYLQGLKEDLLISQKALDRVIRKTDRVSETVTYLIDIIRVNKSKIETINMDSLIASSAGYTIFMGSEGVINDILGSGQLGLITNAYLRKEIASWEANLKMIRANEDLSEKNVEKYMNAMNQYMDFTNYEYDSLAFISSKKEAFLNDLDFRNYLFNIQGDSESLNELYKEKKQHIDTLIQVINNELKLNND